MANTFSITLPSTTPGFADNHNNHFRVHLPEPLILEGRWLVGLQSIVYNYSWDVLGAIDDQFIDIHLKNGETVRAPIPRGTYHNPEALSHGLRTFMIEEARKNTRKRRAAIETTPSEGSVYRLTDDPPDIERRLDFIKPFSTILESSLHRVYRNDPEEQHTRDPDYLKRSARKLLYTLGFEPIRQLRHESRLVNEDFERINAASATDPKEKLRLGERLSTLTIVYQKLRDIVAFVDWLLSVGKLSAEDIDRLPNEFRRLTSSDDDDDGGYNYLYEVGEIDDPNHLILALEPICDTGSGDTNPDLYGREILYGARLTRILKYSPSLARYREECAGELRFAMNAPITIERLKKRLLSEGAAVIRETRDEVIRFRCKRDELAVQSEINSIDKERHMAEIVSIQANLLRLENKEKIHNWILHHTSLSLEDVERLQSAALYEKNLVQKYEQEIAQLRSQIDRLKKEAEIDVKCEETCETVYGLETLRGLTHRKALEHRRSCIHNLKTVNVQLAAKLQALTTECDERISDSESIPPEELAWQWTRKNLLSDRINMLEDLMLQQDEEIRELDRELTSKVRRARRSTAASIEQHSIVELQSEIVNYTNELRTLNPRRDEKQLALAESDRRLSEAIERRASAVERVRLNQERTQLNQELQLIKSRIRSILSEKNQREIILLRKRNEETERTRVQEEQNRVDKEKQEASERIRIEEQKRLAREQQEEAARLVREQQENQQHLDKEQKDRQEEIAATKAREQQANRERLERVQKEAREHQATAAAEARAQADAALAISRPQVTTTLAGVAVPAVRLVEGALVREAKMMDAEARALEQQHSQSTKETRRSRASIGPYVEGIHFEFVPSHNRFRLRIASTEIDHLALSPQLGYMLGFEESRWDALRNGDMAKYTYDLKGGIGHFCVNTPGLTESAIIGNRLTSTLRIVAVKGEPGHLIEEIYDSPIYSRVLPRRVDVVEVEIRTLGGHYVPFEYGIVIVTLLFKKALII